MMSRFAHGLAVGRAWSLTLLVGCGSPADDDPGAPRPDATSDSTTDLGTDAGPPDSGADAIDSGTTGDATDGVDVDAAPTGVKPWACKKAPTAAKATTSCGDDGWCWAAPTPFGYDLDAVGAVTASDVWAGGKDGVLVHWDGTAWSTSKRPGGPGASDVVAFERHPTDGLWMLDATCGVSRFDGTSWVKSSTCTMTTSAADLFVGAMDDAWVVGGSGKTAHWNGTSWTSIAAPVIYDLVAVHGFSKSDAWSVGNAGTIARWDGTKWTTLTSPIADAAFNAVWGLAPNDVWIAGYAKSVLHWNGTELTAVLLPKPTGPLPGIAVPTIGAIWGTSTNDVWFAESGTGSPAEPTMLHWDGTTITRSTTFAGGGVDAIAAVSSTDAWAVGRGGALLHFDGAAWVSKRGGSDMNVAGFWGSASDDVWAVGNLPDMEGAVLHYDGVKWSEQLFPMGDLYAIWGIAPDDVWATGNSRVLHWNGKTWSGTVIDGDIRHVWGAKTDDIWGVGESGLQHWNGKKWSATAPLPYIRRAAGIAGTSSNDVWIVGDDEYFSQYLMRWNGVEWKLEHEFRPDGANFPLDVFAVASNDVWVLGTGKAYHWDGSLFLGAETSTGTYSRGRSWGFGPRDVWSTVSSFTPAGIATASATLHWDGFSWTKTPLALGTEPTAIWGCTPDEIWMGGPYGAMVRRKL